MKKYICTIKEFCDITQPGKNVVEYRMTIEAIPEEKKNKPDEKQYREIYKINILCSEERKIIWEEVNKLSENDLEKVLCEHAHRNFEEKFREGNLPDSGTLDLELTTTNSPDNCPYDLKKIKCDQNLTFPVEVERKIGFG